MDSEVTKIVSAEPDFVLVPSALLQKWKEDITTATGRTAAAEIRLDRLQRMVLALQKQADEQAARLERLIASTSRMQEGQREDEGRDKEVESRARIDQES